jgi:hypothetical protein
MNTADFVELIRGQQLHELPQLAGSYGGLTPGHSATKSNTPTTEEGTNGKDDGTERH